MRHRNAALFVALAAIWGSAFPAIKAGLAAFPPVLFAAVRYDVAGVLMLGYAAHATDRLRPPHRRGWVAVGVGAVFLIAGYHAFLFVGEQFTTSAAAAVVVSLSPVLTGAFARLLLGQRLGALGATGLLLGLAGVAILTRPEPGALAGDVRGELLVFGAALSFAFGSVVTRRLDAGLPIETMEAWSMVFGALVLHGASLALGEPQALPLSATGVASLAYLSLGASAVGFLVYFDLLERLGPVGINLVSYLAPVFSAVVGWALLGERVDAYTAAGFAVIVVGFALVKRRELRRTVRRRLRG